MSSVAAVTPEELQAVEDALAELEAHAQAFAQRTTHPWRGCNGWGPQVLLHRDR